MLPSAVRLPPKEVLSMRGFIKAIAFVIFTLGCITSLLSIIGMVGQMSDRESIIIPAVLFAAGVLALLGSSIVLLLIDIASGLASDPVGEETLEEGSPALTGF
jgi:hypothetical protein